MMSFSILTKIFAILFLVAGLVAYVTPYWLQVTYSPLFNERFTGSFGILYVVITVGSTTVTSTYYSTIPLVFLVADVLFGIGFIFLIVSITRFFRAEKYNNANARNSSFAQKFHKQSLGFLIATIVLFMVALIWITIDGASVPVQNSSSQQRNQVGSSNSINSSESVTVRGISFGFSFYLGWVSLLFSFFAVAFNYLVYKRTFVDALKRDNTVVAYTTG